MLARAKIVPATLGSDMLSENERKLCEKLSSSISIAVLSRMWQMLIKGISELNSAPMPLKALEMILVRVAYSANLPTPAELLSEVKKKSSLSVISHVNYAKTVQTEPVKQFVAESKAVEEKSDNSVNQETQNTDINFSLNDFVLYLTEHKKLLLLYSVKNDISIEEFASGHIKMAISDKIAPDFMQNFHKELENASGIKWKVDIRRGPLGETLADKERAALEQDKQSVSEYPLIKAILSEFPGAKIDTLVRKVSREETEDEENLIVNTYDEE